MLDILAPSRHYVSVRRPFPAAQPGAPDERPDLSEFEPEERLLIALIRRALYDLTSPNLYHRYDALKYFRGDNFADDCAAIGLNYEKMHARILSIWRTVSCPA